MSLCSETAILLGEVLIRIVSPCAPSTDVPAGLPFFLLLTRRPD
jgi:hypothetical protein